MRWTVLIAFLGLAACTSTSPQLDGSLDGRVQADANPTPLDTAADLPVDTVPCTLLEPYSTKNAVCNACAEAKCCPEINGCLADPECNDSYVNCTLACALSPVPDAGIDSCLKQCDSDYPAGKAKYDVAIGCAEARCADECS
jgi:hypothetical protein